jgi:hypothetical protein
MAPGSGPRGWLLTPRARRWHSSGLYWEKVVGDALVGYSPHGPGWEAGVGASEAHEAAFKEQVQWLGHLALQHM